MVMMRNQESAARTLVMPGEVMPGEDGVRSGYVTPHVESYESTRTGELIRVSCHCAMSSNHTHAESLNLPENASIRL